jgi:hypothetical protein
MTTEPSRTVTRRGPGSTEFATACALKSPAALTCVLLAGLPA